ncbi:MAG: hypothetical protein JRF72_07425, partial [Deltaproteobacteria bacterium]|nr:hypothetical protein [Deltaproteobacteria bacterium]
MSKKLIVFIILVLGLIYLIVSAPAFSRIIRDGNKTFIVDMYGERWEVTQAM